MDARYTDAGAFIIDAIPRYPVASALAEVAESTDGVYRAFLDAMRSRYGIDEFAPWDVKFCLHQMEKEIQTSGIFEFGNMEVILRQTLQDLGYDDDANISRFN